MSMLTKVYHSAVKELTSLEFDIALLNMSSWSYGRHLPYGITQSYLPPDTSERARLTPARQAGTRLSYHGGMEG